MAHVSEKSRPRSISYNIFLSVIPRDLEGADAMIHPSPCPPEVRNRGWDRLSPLISEQTQPEKPPPTSTCRLGKAAPSSTVSGRGAIRSSVRRLPGSEWKGAFFKLYFQILFPPQASCRAPLRAAAHNCQAPGRVLGQLLVTFNLQRQDFG